jgi:hypothetical protein
MEEYLNDASREGDDAHSAATIPVLTPTSNA